MRHKNCYTIDSLTIESTRKCNMSCAHCLRGKAQNVDISRSVLEETLKPFHRIGRIQFTGGEPSLFPEAMKWTVEILKDRSIELGSFHLVTNGKRVSDEFMSALLDLWLYVEERDEVSGIQISQTEFHEEWLDCHEGIDKLMAFKFAYLQHYDKRKGKMGYGNTEQIVKMGGAIEYGLGDSLAKDSVFKPTIIKDGKNWSFHETDDIMVDVHGNVILGCDWSYHSQKRYTFGNVFDSSIPKLLIKTFEDRIERYDREDSDEDNTGSKEGVDLQGSP